MGKGRAIGHELLMEQYLLGKSDPEIARALGCSASAVQKWRRRNDLAPWVAPRRPGPYRRKDADPPAAPPVRRAKKKMPQECSRCRFLGLLTPKDAQKCCDFAIITGKLRSQLPPRDDGICPGFEEGVPAWRQEDGGQ